MKFLILGGNGYLGSKIVKRLAEQGHELFCIIRPGSNLHRLQDLEGITYVLNTEEIMMPLLKVQKFDWILNMACCYGKGHEDYNSVMESNFLFPLKIMDLSVKSNKASILTIGTGLPCDINMYSFTKAKFAEFGRFYSEKEHIKFIHLKLEMFYGSDEPKDRFLPGCINKMLHGYPLDLTDGLQRRDIVSIEDVVEAIFFVIDLEVEGYHEYSVGTGEGPRIREIIQYIKEQMGSHSDLHFGAVPKRGGETDCIGHPDELERLGYRYKYPWKQGISRMIEEIYRDHNDTIYRTKLAKI